MRNGGSRPLIGRIRQIAVRSPNLWTKYLLNQNTCSWILLDRVSPYDLSCR